MRRRPRWRARTCRCPMPPPSRSLRCRMSKMWSRPSKRFVTGPDHARQTRQNLEEGQLSLWRGQVRRAHRPRSRTRRLQLFDVCEDRISASDRPQSGFPVADRQEQAHDLHVQHRHREAHLLLGVRDKIILRPALASRWLERELPLSQCARLRFGHDDRVRRQELGRKRHHPLAAGEQVVTTQILMPALSPTMEEGKLAKWLVKEGDVVKSGDILAEIETDKATMEFEAVDEGRIGKLLVTEGTEG